MQEGLIRMSRYNYDRGDSRQLFVYFSVASRITRIYVVPQASGLVVTIKLDGKIRW